MVVAHECVEIAFILVFWPFGRGYEPRPDTKTLLFTSNYYIFISFVSGSLYTNITSFITKNYTDFITLNHFLLIFESLVLIGQSLFISYFSYYRSKARFNNRFNAT
jgi:hypothetical protein